MVSKVFWKPRCPAGLETTCVGDAKSASAFGIDVEKVVVKGVVGDRVKIAELVVDGGEVCAREVALGVSVMGGVGYESWWRRLSRGACGRVVGSSREGIRNAVAFVGAGLAWSDIFLGEDGGDNGVVSADGEVLPVEVRVPHCKGVNHGEEFLLLGGVIHQRGKELLACEGDGVFSRWSLGVSGRVLDGGGLGGVAGEMLGQYASDGEVGGVSGDIEMASGVGDLEDRGRGDGLLEQVESVLAAIVPMEGLVLAGELVERVRDLGKVANERAVIVGKAEEGTELEEGLGWGVLDEGCDLRGVHTDAFSGDNVAEDREDLAEVLKAGLEGGAEDKDVIKVDDDTDFEEVAEDVVHGRLESSGGIGESEWHHEELVVPEPRAEGGLVGVLIADTDLVEATAKVDLGKVLGSTEMIKELRNPRTSPMGGPTNAISMPGQCPGDCVHDEEGPSLAEGDDAEVAGRVEADWRVNCAALGQLVCWCPNWRQRKQTPFAWRGDVMEKAGAGGGGRRLVMAVEESIVVKHAREEVSKGHVGFVGEGSCKVFVAYSFDAGDERKVRNDGGGDVVAEGVDILDEAVHRTGVAEVAELFKVVINGFLGAKGGSEKVGPLEEGLTWSSGGSTVADFSHPPFGGIAEEAGGGNGELVGKGHVVEVKRVIGGGAVAGVVELLSSRRELGGNGGIAGVLDAPDEGGGGGNETVVDDEEGGRVEEGGLVDVVVEVVGVEEVGGGVLLEAAVEEGVVCAVEEGGAAVVTTVMEGLFPSSVVTRSDMDDTVAFISLREAVTEVWRVLSVWRMAERSGVAVFAGGCSPVRLRAMLSTESVRMSDMWVMLSTESVRMSYMLMEDVVMSGEEGVENAAGTDVEDAVAAMAEATTADEVEAGAAAAAAATAVARWEVLDWRGGMWRFGSGRGWGWGGYLQH
ncbi:hypothetical protein CBR_g16912 [Chara braunii]|uniref:Uncharacterized protein n=1 Tax=Chara braunii TaxID=69332 RepID=A0A388KU95_CHABU|nr:hypothetical protein CBR_g16912 [Chara braunii]|eukprot:GBG73568.1 hypothetical protein CBR_g16912 [Chara braunii]